MHVGTDLAPHGRAEPAPHAKEVIMRLAASVLVALGLALGAAEDLSAQQIGVAENDPGVAVLYALLCPGCGHLYSGETAKGAIIATVSVGALFGGMAMWMNQEPRVDCVTRHGTMPECRTRGNDLTPVLVGSAIGLAGYLYGLIDAAPSARRMQARSGFELGPFEAEPSLGWSGEKGGVVMLRISPAR